MKKNKAYIPLFCLQILLCLFLILLLIGDFDFEVGVGAFSKQLVQNSFLLLFVLA